MTPDKQQALDKLLNKPQEVSCKDFLALGLPFEAFLRWGKVSAETQRKAAESLAKRFI